MDIRLLLAASAMLGAASCVTPDAVATDCGDTTCAALGEAFTAGAVTITPLEVLEDSRCPIEADCITEGDLRIRALVERGEREREIELNWHDPLPAFSGNLVLTEVWPENSTQTMPLPPEAYRFHFEWTAVLIGEPAASDL